MAASDVSDEETDTDSHIFMILSFLFFSCVASPMPMSPLQNNELLEIRHEFSVQTSANCFACAMNLVGTVESADCVRETRDSQVVLSTSLSKEEKEKKRFVLIK